MYTFSFRSAIKKWKLKYKSWSKVNKELEKPIEILKKNNTKSIFYLRLVGVKDKSQEYNARSAPSLTLKLCMIYWGETVHDLQPRYTSKDPVHDFP